MRLSILICSLCESSDLVEMWNIAVAFQCGVVRVAAFQSENPLRERVDVREGISNAGRPVRLVMVYLTAL